MVRQQLLLLSGNDDRGSIDRVAHDGGQRFVGLVEREGRYLGLKMDLRSELEKIAGIRAQAVIIELGNT